jgi:hypothetical protein
MFISIQFVLPGLWFGLKKLWHLGDPRTRPEILRQAVLTGRVTSLLGVYTGFWDRYDGRYRVRCALWWRERWVSFHAFGPHGEWRLTSPPISYSDLIPSVPSMSAPLVHLRRDAPWEVVDAPRV